MIENGSGDLLAADVEALVNTVNCVGVMGKGLALQFKRRYPESFESYARACKDGEVKLGRMHVVELNAITGPEYVVNFPTKGHWKANSKLSDIETGLDDLVRVIKDRSIKSIAIPPLGAGNGGLPWSDVEPLIRAKLAELPAVTVLLFTPSNADRHLAPEPVKMTWGRSTLVELLQAYTAQRRAAEPWEDPTGASHLELQKLMYFAQITTPELKLEFAQGYYGPYSEKVRHLIQGMEGTFVEGFGDGSKPVQELTPIHPTKTGRAESEEYLRRAGSEKDVRAKVVAPVMELIEGFEGAYSIELLASTHWVAQQNRCADAHEAWKAIQEWTRRKGRLFTEHHVSTAWEHLREIGALRSTAHV